MNFVAIDFETANYSRDSACSIGLARCENDTITETYQTLIKPPRMYFAPACIDVHGILPSDVRGCPTFGELWTQIHDFIGNSTLVAHNAPFDRGVLMACLERYGFPAIDNPWDCTLRRARSVLGKSLPNHRLDTVAEHFGFTFQHHDSLEDAVACARIMVSLCTGIGDRG